HGQADAGSPPDPGFLLLRRGAHRRRRRAHDRRRAREDLQRSEDRGRRVQVQEQDRHGRRKRSTQAVSAAQQGEPRGTDALRPHLPRGPCHAALPGGPHMTRRELKNVAASVHARLLNKAREEGRRLDELLQYYAMARFLFRLSQPPHVERFVLKGALMLRTHAIEQHRLTRDIDLLRYGPSRIENLEQIVRDCLRLDVPDDGLVFDPESVEGSEISREAEYQGVRIRFTGHLGNARTVMQLDVGFGDAVVPGPIWIDYPEL